MEEIVVDATDGISQAEAAKIALVFFRTKNGNLCGGILIPKDEGEVWRVPIVEGLFPLHTKDVVIEKLTGEYRIEPDPRNARPNQAASPTP